MNYTRPELRDLQCVLRWSIVPMFRRQSVAEHSFFVTLYAIELYHIALDTMPGPHFIKWALTHDADEIHSGDIPTPYKRFAKIPSAKPPEEMDPLDVQIIRIADILESFLFMLEENLLGNYKSMKIKEQLRRRLHDETAKIPLIEIREKIWHHIENVVTEYYTYKGRVE